MPPPGVTYRANAAVTRSATPGIGLVLAWLLYGLSLEALGLIDKRAAWMMMLLVTTGVILGTPGFVSELTRLINAGRSLQ